MGENLQKKKQSITSAIIAGRFTITSGLIVAIVALQWKSLTMPEQIKKNPNDPDIETINPELIQYAKDIGFLRGPFNLYLHGLITYQEALETMVLIMTREYRQIMSRIVKKKIQQRADHSDLIQHPLALSNETNTIEVETTSTDQDGSLSDEGDFNQDN